MLPKFMDKSKIPHKSGIYMFKNNVGNILYIGKAVDLYSRVSSYFNGNPDSPKTASLVENIRDFDTIIVESELEALILEANLIKKYLPPYNIRLTDNKDYLYIAITNEKFPKILTARKQDLKKMKIFFGPFPSGKTVRETLKKLRRIFPWCSNPPKPGHRKPRACFYYHLGLCPGACVGKISSKDYQENINRFSKFLSGKTQELLEELSLEMLQASENQEFEKASQLKRMITGIQYLIQPNRVSKYLENPNFLEDETKQALEDLKKALNLKKIPKRIEAYDISNIQGHQSTGSLVVLTNGEIDKSQYRKFKIQITGRPNDVGMHKEMIRRRLKNDWLLPDLIIIDGGRGQVRAAQLELQLRNLNIPIYGLAKRMEWLYPVEGEVIKLSRRNLGLKLLQKIRDEAHRFAITYHRKLRAREFLPVQ